LNHNPHRRVPKRTLFPAASTSAVALSSEPGLIAPYRV